LLQLQGRSMTRRIAHCAVFWPSPIVSPKQSAKRSLHILCCYVVDVSIHGPELTNAYACECSLAVVVSTFLQ
jgi:hypothetical protein